MLDEVDRMVKELAPPVGPHVPDPPLQFAGETSMLCNMSCNIICDMFILPAHVLLSAVVDRKVEELAPPTGPCAPDTPLQFAGGITGAT
jgi:hypothetical protein